MRIINLQAENIKRLVAVDITPDGDVVKITGKNGQGKSSVLDAIWMALGGKDEIPSQPIRKGEEKAKIQLDLGDLIVKRRFTKSGTTLQVENKDGASYKSPQRMLENLIGRMSFDPLGFMELKPKEQAVELRKLVELPIDPDEMDRQRQELFEERTAVNRTIKGLEGKIDGRQLSDDDPMEEQSIADAMEAVQEAERHNLEIDGLEQRLQVQRGVYKDKQTRIEELKAEIERLEAELPEIEKAASGIKAELQKKERKDVDALRADLSTLEERNRQARENAQLAEDVQELEGSRKYAETLTERIRAIDEKKAKALAEAKMPVEGLSFEEGIVTYNGIPLEQASTAEQLRVSIAIAMAANPKLRVIRIRDGNHLDSDSWKVVEEMAREHDFQVWAEVVDESGKVGVVIEDGQVKAAEEAA